MVFNTAVGAAAKISVTNNPGRPNTGTKMPLRIATSTTSAAHTANHSRP